MQVEQKDGYTVIDRRGYSEPCRVCGCKTECHSQQYGKPTMKCIEHLREQASQSETLRLAFVQVVPGLVSKSWEDIYERVRDAFKGTSR